MSKEKKKLGKDGRSGFRKKSALIKKRNKKNRKRNSEKKKKIPFSIFGDHVP
jgi:hypothetical protein